MVIKMANYAIVYNPLSGNGRGEEESRNLSKLLKDDKLEYFDITKIGDINGFLEKLPQDTRFLLAGGDGTVNRFVNAVDESRILSRPIYYYGTGTGNDFMIDLGIPKGSMPFVLNKYIINLPTVTIDGKTSKFLNGIGYGIDGYCCEEGDKLRKIPGKKINYTAIAVKGLLFKYSSTNATVTSDGKTTSYKKVWLTPTMNGRFFGGGIMPTPMQDRLKNETVSTMVFHNWRRLSALIAFPSTFKGEHLKYTDKVAIIRSKEVTVSYDRPTPLQIDGETVLGVTSYTVRVCGSRVELPEEIEKAAEQSVELAVK